MPRLLLADDVGNEGAASHAGVVVVVLSVGSSDNR